MVCTTLGELSRRIGANLRGDPGRGIKGVATLDAAGEGELSFLANRAYKRHLAHTRAAAVILAPRDAPDCPVDALVTAEPYVGYARAAQFLFPVPAVRSGIAPSAEIADDARIDRSAYVGPRTVIGAGARIGPRACLGPGCIVGPRVEVGADTRLLANVTLLEGTRIGGGGLFHPGAVIAAEGFGFACDKGTWIKIPQLGGVTIGDNVEIGANTTIARGALCDTVIGDGVKIDNQVQIGHNVRIGANTIIAGCVGIAGSARIGRDCRIGGGCAINSYAEIADGVLLAGRTTVHRSISRAGAYASSNMMTDLATWRRNTVRMQHLHESLRDMRERIAALEARERRGAGGAGGAE